MSKALDVFEKVIYFIAITFITLGVISIIVQTLGRYLQYNLYYYQQLSPTLICIGMWFAASVALGRPKYILSSVLSIDNNKRRKVTALVALGLQYCFVGLFLYKSIFIFDISYGSGQPFQTINLPKWWLHMFLPISGLIMLVFTLAETKNFFISSVKN